MMLRGGDVRLGADRERSLVIAGGSGFLGGVLIDHFARRGWRVHVLSRSPIAKNLPAKWHKWDGRSLGQWSGCLESADALVNLCGRSVQCPKSQKNRRSILESRVESTVLLGEALSTLEAPPPIWLQMSTAHYYGDLGRELCTEWTPKGDGFAPEVAEAWEAAFEQGRLPEQRGVILRTSFVLGRDRGQGGGALEMLKWLASLGLGGRVGSGEQGFSWIHEADFAGIVELAIEDSSLDGVLNVTAPQPVSQREFMRCLRTCLGVRIGLPAPEMLVRVAAPLLLNSDPELAIKGRYISPERLNRHEMSFQYPELAAALEQLLANKMRKPA